MKIIQQPAQSGKTTDLIKWLRESDERLLITFSHEEENRVKSLYPDINKQVVSWDTYQKHRDQRFHWKECAIDNFDMVISRMVDLPIKIVTFTDDDE